MAIDFQLIVNYFPIFNDINVDFVSAIKLFYVFGGTGNEALVVANDDSVYAFGRNENRCLGLNCFDSITTPTKLNEFCEEEVIKFDSGSALNVIALTNSGHVYSWGPNKCGQLGHGSRTAVNRPQLIADLTDIIDVSCGGSHVLVLSQNGKVYAFGDNSNGQIGNDSHDNQMRPLLIDYFNDEIVVAIACGADHSLALTMNGMVYSWGSNEFCQLGVVGVDQCIPICVTFSAPIFVNTIVSSLNRSYFLTDKCELYSTCFPTHSNDKPIKLLNESEGKIIDIAASVGCRVSIARSEHNVNYICDEKLTQLKESESLSIDYLFATHSDIKITHKTIDLSNENKQQNKFVSLIKSAGNNNRYKLEFNELDKISNGEFSIACKVICKYDHKLYSIRRISHKIRKNNSVYGLLTKINSEFIIKHYDYWNELNNNLRTGKMFAQLECYSSTLKDILNFHQKRGYPSANIFPTILIDYYIASELFKEILEGVNFLHKQNPSIIHRDLKPENLYLDNGKKGRFVIIGNFELSTTDESKLQLENNILTMNNSSLLQINFRDLGTASYIAPEISYFEHDTKTDVYSLGVIALQLFANNMDIAFSISDMESNAMMKVLRKNFSNTNDIALNLLSVKRDNRKNCDEVLSEESLWTLSVDEIENNLCENDINIKKFWDSEVREYFKYLENENYIMQSAFICFIESKLSKLDLNLNFLHDQIDCYTTTTALSKNLITNIFSVDDSHLKNAKYSQEFEEIEHIGCGGFGVVFKVRDLNLEKNISEEFYAIKKIPFKKESQNYKYAENEFKFLLKLNSDFVVTIYDFWFEDNYYINSDPIENSSIDRDLKPSGKTKLFDPNCPILLHIQMELCPLTLPNAINDIQNYLRNTLSGKLSSLGYYIASQLFAELLEGVNYLHRQTPSIIHRDLKPENIFLSNGLNGRFVKIGDFSLATNHELVDTLHTRGKGTINYMAPEVLSSRKYDTKADIYCVGLIAINLFDIEINETIKSTHMSTNLWQKYTNLQELIVNKLLSPKPSDRLSCSEILASIEKFTLCAEEMKADDSVTNILHDYIKSEFSTLDIRSNFCRYFIKIKFSS